MSNVRCSQIWTVVSKWLPTPNKHAAFWWEATGSTLGDMLSQAGYNEAAQVNALLFHYRYVITAFGPRPCPADQPRWRSFMTDDFSPLEYSWTWDRISPPKIRYSIEAIGRHAGSTLDPYNRSATLKIANDLRRALPQSDWQWFDHFVSSFHEPNQDVCLPQQKENNSLSSPSSMFLAFEFNDNDIAAKAYFIPVKARQIGESPLSIIKNSIYSLPEFDDSTYLPAHQRLQEFLQTHSLGKALEGVGVSLDCVSPETSRLKYYLRSPSSSFNNVCSIMALGGAEDSKLSAALKKLQQLWQMVLGLEEGFATDQELEAKYHETLGVLYHFDIRPGLSRPDPKLYIPVRHYGRNDRDILGGLARYLKMEGVDSGYVDGYRRTLENLCRHRSLESDCGLQTYISVAIKGEKLSLASYIAPEVYHPSRRMLIETPSFNRKRKNAEIS